MTTLSRRALALHASTALLVAIGLAPLAARSSPAGAIAGSVTLTATYTGTGPVDGNHRLWIWLFDTPDFGPDSMPLREESLDTNGGSVTIKGLADAQVWVVVAYDEQGGFFGSAPPPSGSPIGIYSADGRGPSALSSAEDAAATITFDASRRMP